jgi:phosphoribosyl-ATP pyrophosphohydrolase
LIARLSEEAQDMTDAFSLDDLAALIARRAAASADQSYTRSLLESGTGRIAKKFGEEAVEAVIAAAERDAGALKMEAADVLYHLLVLLQDGGVPLQDVIDELARRTQQSGHQEKASRTS